MKNKSKYAVAGLVLFALAYIVMKYDIFSIRPEDIRDFILSFGIMAPIVYILLYSVRPLILFPASIFTIASGLSFGSFFGTIYTLIGATAGAVLSFLISRYLGAEAFSNTKFGKRFISEKNIKDYGFKAVFTMRLIPIFPFDMISYGAGLSGMGLGSFFIATMVGMIPGTFAFNFLGASLLEPFSKNFYIAIGMVLFLMVVPGLVKKYLNKKA